MEVSVFPRISLKPDVTHFLQSVYLNQEVGVYTIYFISYFCVCLSNDKNNLFVLLWVLS